MQADPGLPPSIAKSPSQRGSALRCPDRGVGGHRGPSRASRAVDDLANENRYSEHDERRACHLVGVMGRRRNRLCCHASMRSKFTSMATPRSTSTRPRPTAMRRIVQRRTSVVKEVPANPQTAPSPTPDRLRGGPDATGAAVGIVAGGGPRAASRVAASFLGNPSPCDGLARRPSVWSPSWQA